MSEPWRHPSLFGIRTSASTKRFSTATSESANGLTCTDGPGRLSRDSTGDADGTTASLAFFACPLNKQAEHQADVGGRMDPAPIDQPELAERYGMQGALQQRFTRGVAVASRGRRQDSGRGPQLREPEPRPHTSVRECVHGARCPSQPDHLQAWVPTSTSCAVRPIAGGAARAGSST